MDIIFYLLNIIQYQQKQIRWFLHFICRYIPLKQWAFDDSHSPKYQKFKVDKLPRIISYQQDWTWKDLIPYYKERYGKVLKPVFRRVKCDIPDDCTCPMCKAPVNYDLTLWVTYYNFLRPHKHKGYRVLNYVQELEQADNMPGKWQLLIYLGQCRIKEMQQQDEARNCSQIPSPR